MINGVPVNMSFGGGADGSALLAEVKRRKIEIDLITFSDTGRGDAEKPETYRHVEFMHKWCLDNLGVGVTTVRNDGMYVTLETNCLAKNILPSVAYGFKSCSDKYKHRPQDKFAKTWPPAIEAWARGQKVIKIIGYNADEWHRVRHIDDPLFDVQYWLVDWGITRKMVEHICLEEFGYVPSKSACFFCPSSKKSEVKWLARTHPDLFARAVAMEHNVDYNSKSVQIDCPECSGVGCGVCEGRGWFIERNNTVVGLGRHWSWEEIVAADENQFKLFPEAPEIACMCFDGGTCGDE